MKEGVQPSFDELQRLNLDSLYRRMDNPSADPSNRMRRQFAPNAPFTDHEITQLFTKRVVEEHVVFQQ